jgi:hypothetical protein
MPTLRSDTLLASSWPCHRCSHSNDSSRNKKRCSSCRAWRDGLAPLSAKGGGTSTSGAAASASDAGLVGDDATCHDENGPPNNASPRRDGSPTKRGGKRKSPPRGLGGMVLHPLPPPMPPALRSTRSITPLAPPSECLGIYRVGFFGPALTFAAKSMEHTANQLRQWAKEPDLGVKSFADSILSKSRSICIPYQGVLLDRTSNPGEGFVFRAESCSGNCSNGKRCSHCASKINVGNKVRESVQAIVECAGKQASITKISSNPVLAAMEIRMAREEIRRLRCELARVVLFDAMELRSWTAPSARYCSRVCQQ